MTIGADHYALIEFFHNGIPASGVALCGHTKIFYGGIVMMKLKRIHTTIVAAGFAPTAFVFNRHSPDFLSPGVNGSDQILAPIVVFSLFDFGQLSPPFSMLPRCAPSFALGASRLVHSQMLYRLSYRGVKAQRAILRYR